MSNNTPIKELSISIACLLDEPDTIKVKDIEHLQNLTTQIENQFEDLNHYQNNTIVAYDRSQLDDAIGKKATDYQWQMCQEAIHNDEGAWSAMSDACAEAEDDIQHLIDEEETNNE